MIGVEFQMNTDSPPLLRLLLRDEAGRARLTPALLERLTQALCDKHQVTLAVLEGEGAFCEGLDLETWAADGDEINGATRAKDALRRYGDLLATIEKTSWPVVALVDGAAMGGGVGICAASDLVVASPRATFSLPETVMGLVPAMVFPPLARRIGVPRARLMALGAKPLSAQEAYRVGLVDEIADDLEKALARHARRFARSDARAVRAMKALVAMHFAEPPDYKADATLRCTVLLSSRETQARIARFQRGETPWEESP
jgi:enoyl-CoA hydratase/carnithine racemase